MSLSMDRLAWTINQFLPMRPKAPYRSCAMFSAVGDRPAKAGKPVF